MKINHIGIVVRNIDKALQTYVQDYGFKPQSSVIDIENQQVRVILLANEDNVKVELIEPKGVDSPAYNALKRGGGLNHICYETEEFDALAERFKNKIVRSPRPAPEEYFSGGRTFFIFRNGELVEFLEKR